jgi:hypothetical protein
VLAEGQGGEKQVEAVRQLFHRQLQTPQPAAQQLLQEYEEWERETGQVSEAGLLVCMCRAPAWFIEHLLQGVVEKALRWCSHAPQKACGAW